MTLSGFVAYIKQLWANKPSTSSPLSAERLNHMEEGIKANSDGITKIVTSVTDQVVNDSNKIPSAASLYSVKQVVDKTNSDLAGLSMRIQTKPTIGSNIPANGFYDVTWDYRVPDGYNIIAIEVVHTGSHFLLPFGVVSSGNAGSVKITVHLSNRVNYELTNISPTCTVSLVKAL